MHHRTKHRAAKTAFKIFFIFYCVIEILDEKGQTNATEQTKNEAQQQDTGGKIVHNASNTSSVITSKSISKDGGRASYRGLLKVAKGAHDSKSQVVCDALLLDPASRSDTYPYIEIDEDDVEVGHEASVSKIGEEQLFYLTSRGISEDEAAGMIVGGFIEPLVKELPMEYAVEMNRLIQLQMEGSIG